nr:unnamed protein product [Callosobruchus analis]
MLLEPERAEKIVLGCCSLHNFLRKSQSSSSYCPPGTFDSEDMFTGDLIPATWRVESQPNGRLLIFKRILENPVC